MKNEHLVAKISVNCRYQLAENMSGVQNWSKNTVNELSKIQGIQIHEHIPHRIFRSGIFGHLWEQFLLPFLARKSDLLFSPGNSGPILFRKQIICVHDALVFTHPHFFGRLYRITSKTLLKSYNEHRVQLVTVSENSKLEISKIVPRNMVIEVVGMGITQIDDSDSKKKSTVETIDFFLFVGGNIERKNLAFLLNFWDFIHKKTGYFLIVTMGKQTKSLSSANVNDVQGVRYVSTPDDQELSFLYKNSRALLWPSIAEGFGMPLLESISHGTPFISSPVGAAEELLAGESKILELKEELWLQAIFNLITVPKKNPMEQIEVSSNYSWKKVAEKITDAFFSFL